ncbi:MAG: aminotransferase DegT [Planctomyces sp.]|nr:aminotransferase DegT [Planctomyces sp.]
MSALSNPPAPSSHTPPAAAPLSNPSNPAAAQPAAQASLRPAERLAQDGGSPAVAPPVPFMVSKPTEADVQAITEVARSGMLRASKKCEELEQRFGALSGARHAMTCANGTCALQLAYEPLINPGDDVLVPAWSYIATASMIVARGARPVFADADLRTGQIDAHDAERRLTPRTTAIAATHMYGCPVDIDAVQALAARYNLAVVYDAAQAHLSTYKGALIGRFGHAVTYSFYATKNLGTGEGGMITTNDDALARTVRLLRSHGETDKYLHERVGYNYRMNDLTGALGCSRLDRLEAETNARRAAAAAYDALLAPGGELSRWARPLAVTPGAVSAYHLYTIVLDTARLARTRDEVSKALAAEGVPTAVHYPRALPDQPAFAAHVPGQRDWPVARGLAASVLSLPMHHALSPEQIAGVGRALRKVFLAFSR